MSRLERDFLGEFSVPMDALYGCHTARALANFPLVTPLRPLSDYPEFLYWILQIKLASAVVNETNRFISGIQRQLIEKAIERVLDRHIDEASFPIPLVHGGGGTSANMNVNEVVAHVAGLINGERLGSYCAVSPTETVNCNQSTNEIVPSALRIAAVYESEMLISQLEILAEKFDELVCRIGNMPRMVRTCYQDSIVGTFADLFGGIRHSFTRLTGETRHCSSQLRAINLGGGVAGNKATANRTYGEGVLLQLSKQTDLRGFVIADNLADAAQSNDSLVSLGDSLDRISRQIIRVSNNLRVLGSGPEAGIGEILLESVQPGSSAMPGKVNPVLPEHAIQLSTLVCGRISSLRMTLDMADPDLNVWEMVSYLSISESISLISLAVQALSRAVGGMQVNQLLADKVRDLDAPRRYTLSKQIGYEAAALQALPQKLESSNNHV